jgi:hypothetical protein
MMIRMLLISSSFCHRFRLFNMVDNRNTEGALFTSVIGQQIKVVSQRQQPIQILTVSTLKKKDSEKKDPVNGLNVKTRKNLCETNSLSTSCHSISCTVFQLSMTSGFPDNDRLQPYQLMFPI